MSEKLKNKGKHLTFHDRTYIEDALNSDYTLKEIADHLSKNTTTISKEIKRNRILKESRTQFQGGCINQRNCQIKNPCSKCCKINCKSVSP